MLDPVEASPEDEEGHGERGHGSAHVPRDPGEIAGAGAAVKLGAGGPTFASTRERSATEAIRMP